MYSSHQSRERVSSGPRSRALFEPGPPSGHERGTHEPHLLRQHSLYVQATKRPLLSLAVAGAGLALAAVVRSRSGGR